ncbi:MAG TPA: ExbD/TolR family protein [Thermoanaerobaculia bacterium]|nr:ExbD/TolR family protein [Thermoanaerobaculia bacterium]
MAFKLDSDDEYGTMADINVTPLVDVMLVLLIIFMVTAPLLMQGLEVELPTAEGKSLESATNNPSKVTVTRAGDVFVDGANAGRTNLELTLGPMLRTRRIKRALLEADQRVPYGRVVQVIDVMNRAGVEQLGMITRPEEGGNAGRRR